MADVRRVAEGAADGPDAGFAHVIVALVVVVIAVVVVVAIISVNRQDTPKIDAASVARNAAPAFAEITTRTETSATVSGGGAVIDAGGQVVTNNHVVAGADAIIVRVGDHAYRARVLGYDVADDLALLQLDDARGLRALSLASTDLRRGAPVITGPETSRARASKILATGQTLHASSADDHETLTGMLELSVPVAPADSGTPVIDARGQLAGVETAAAYGGRFSEVTNANQGYAIPAGRIRAVVQQILEGHGDAHVHVGPSASLGVVVAPASATGGRGAGIESVAAGGPAAGAGLRPGDVVISVGDTTISSPADLATALDARRPGATVRLAWLDRDNVFRFGTATLAAGPPR